MWLSKKGIGSIVGAKMQAIDETDDNSNELHSQLTRTTDDKYLTSDLNFNLNSINILWNDWE
jgi:hypothetical protein